MPKISSVYNTDFMCQNDNKNPCKYIRLEPLQRNMNVINITEKFNLTTCYSKRLGHICFVYDISNLQKQQQEYIISLCKHTSVDLSCPSTVFDDLYGVYCHQGLTTNVRMMSKMKPKYMSKWMVDKICEYMVVRVDIPERIIHMIQNISTDNVTDTKIAEIYYEIRKNEVQYDVLSKTWYILNNYNVWKSDESGVYVSRDVTNLLYPLISDHGHKSIDDIYELMNEMKKIATGELVPDKIVPDKQENKNNKNNKNKKKNNTPQNLVEENEKKFSKVLEILYKRQAKALEYISNTVSKGHFLKELITIYAGKEQNNNISLFEKMNRVNPYIFAFNNCVTDMKTFEQRLAKPSELISVTTGYDWIPYNDKIDKAVQQLETFFSSIFETEEDKEALLTHICMSLVGIPLEHYYIWLGAGGNGKGVVGILIRLVFGKYYDPTNINYIIKSKNQSPTGPDPIIINKIHSRITISTEPDGDAEIDFDKIKGWTGQDDIQARALYSNKMINFKATFQTIIQTNHNIKMPDTGNSIVRRTKVLKFPFNFTSNPITAFDKPEDLNLKEKITTDTHRIAFYYMLLKRYQIFRATGQKRLILSPNFQEQTDILLMSGDNVTPFMNKIIIRTDNYADHVSTAEIFKHYKNFIGETGKSATRQAFRAVFDSKGFPVKLLKGNEVYRNMKINFEALNNKNKNINNIAFLDD